MIKRIFTGLLSLVMVVGLLPATAFAAVTSTNDWDIFDASNTYNLPKTQEQILQSMIQNEKFAENWAAVANEILPDQYWADDGDGRGYKNYKKFSTENYNASNLKYTSKGLRDAVTDAINNSGIRSGSGVLDKLPEGEFPVFYTSTYATGGYSKYSGTGKHATCSGFL